MGPMAAGVCGRAFCGFCGACLPGFCADSSVARTEIRRKAAAVSLAGFRGMNAAILAQVYCVGTGALACPGERSSPPPLLASPLNVWRRGFAPPGRVEDPSPHKQVPTQISHAKSAPSAFIRGEEVSTGCA